MRIVVDSEGLVLMWSDHGSPTPPEGSSLVTLSPQQETAFRALLGDAYAITFDGDGFAAVPAPPVEESAGAKQRALQERRAADLIASPDLADRVEGLSLKLSLLGG